MNQNRCTRNLLSTLNTTLINLCFSNAIPVDIIFLNCNSSQLFLLGELPNHFFTLNCTRYFNLVLSFLVLICRHGYLETTMGFNGITSSFVKTGCYVPVNYGSLCDVNKLLTSLHKCHN